MIKISIAALLALSAIFNTWTSRPDNQPDTTQEIELPDANICDKPSGNLGNESPTTPAQISQSNNAFSLNLYKQTLQQEGIGKNIFLSGYSVRMAFALLHLGAAGETDANIAACMGWPKNSISVHQALGDYAEQLRKNASSTTYTINIANRIWTDVHGFCVSQSYADNVKKYYQAPVQALDFSKPKAAADAINGWVNSNTNGKIKQILGPETLSAAKMVLANAIYFKADWKQAFEKSASQPAEFMGTNGKVTTTFMNANLERKVGARYHRMANFTAARLPYKNDNMSMLIILPNANTSLDKVMAEMSAQDLEDLLVHQGEYYDDMQLSIPKWKTEYSVELGGAILPKMGLSIGQLDLGNMTYDGDFFISAVLHKTFVAVDEEGTEAAAVTAIVVATESEHISRTVSFKADRPFAYCIVDNSTNTVLFMGHITNF